MSPLMRGTLLIGFLEVPPPHVPFHERDPSPRLYGGKAPPPLPLLQRAWE